MHPLRLATHSTHPQRAASINQALRFVGIEEASDTDIWLLDGDYIANLPHTPSAFIWLSANAVPDELQPYPHLILSPPIRPQALLRSCQQLKQRMSIANSALLSSFGPYTVQLAPAQITTPSGPIPITESIAQMLALLVRHPQGVAKDIFLQQLWPTWQSDADTHSFDTQLYRLRQKLATLSPKPIEIILENGLYRLHPNSV